MDRAMYSSTEIDRMQKTEMEEYLAALEKEGKTLYHGKVV